MNTPGTSASLLLVLGLGACSGGAAVHGGSIPAAGVSQLVSIRVAGFVEAAGIT